MLILLAFKNWNFKLVKWKLKQKNFVGLNICGVFSFSQLPCWYVLWPYAYMPFIFFWYWMERVNLLRISVGFGFLSYCLIIQSFCSSLGLVQTYRAYLDWGGEEEERMKESKVEFAEIKLILNHFYLNLLSPHSPQSK